MNQSATNRRGLLLAIVVALATLPLAALYLLQLWDWPHYQFFPMLLLVVAVMLFQRWPRRGEHPNAPTDAIPTVALALVWTGLAIEAGALALFSPWLGYVAFIVAGAGVLCLLSGPGWRDVRMPWLTLLLALRPPMKLDEVLITRLQRATASSSSQLLDWLGVDHVRAGVLIEIPKKMLFVEEACSGVQSLFSLITMAVLLAVWHRRSLVWACLLVAAAAVGAAAMNVVRTVSIVYALDRWDVDLLAEPGHTVLGVAIFIGSLAWLMSFDQLARFLIGEVTVHRGDYESSNLLIRGWNRWIAGVRSESPRPMAGGSTWLSRLGLAGAGGAAALLGAAAIWLAVGAKGSRAATTVAAVRAPASSVLTERLNSLHESAMPETFGAWERTDFERVSRPRRSQFGEHSLTWTYRTPFGQAACSLDYPFPQWHDLRVCYANIGWQVRSSEKYEGTTDDSERMRVFLQKPDMHGYLSFAARNSSGEAAAAPKLEGDVRRFTDRLRKLVDDPLPGSGETFQLQVLIQSAGPLNPAERDDVEQHLESFLRLIQEALNDGAAPSP
ncbi:MAG: exosortase U [Planctomyces sp.]|nr:exosortase U [Planctomyces sp.]